MLKTSVFWVVWHRTGAMDDIKDVCGSTHKSTPITFRHSTGTATVDVV